jgi:uncharacterized membrane protein
MVPQSSCKECIQRHDCQKVYEKLGNTPGESVVLRVVLAFLLPMVVFIVSLAVSERVFAGVTNVEKLQTIFSLLSALLSTFFCIFIIRIIHKELIFRWVAKH